VANFGLSGHLFHFSILTKILTKRLNFLIMQQNELTNKKYLDQGTYGKVFAATYQGRRVAMKVLKASEDEKDKDKDWRRETEILQSVKHPFILSVLGVVDNLNEKELWIVTELLDAGSLRPYCTGDKRDRMTVVDKIAIGFQCWSAISYLHDTANISHKDIKPENILLYNAPSGKLEAKICDFGTAKLRDALAATAKTSITGTAMYFPPELASGHMHPKKGDVYSMGATLIELFTNQWTWHDKATLKPLEYMRVMLLLARIDEKINAKREVKLTEIAPQYGNASSALNSSKCDSMIINILEKTVNYDRNERPLASVAMIVFEKMMLEAMEPCPTHV